MVQRGPTTDCAVADACRFSVPGMTESPTVLRVLTVTAKDVGQESGVQAETAASFSPANQSAAAQAAAEGTPRPFSSSSQADASPPPRIASRRAVLS